MRVVAYFALAVALGTLSNIVLAHGPQQQPEVFAPANDVSFSISTEKDRYQIGDEVTVKYQITNISNHAMFVPRAWAATCPPNPHVWASLESSKGRHFVPGYAGDCSPITQTIAERMNKEAVLLKPKQRVEGTTALTTKVLAGLTPGRYRVEVVLYGWNDSEFDEAQRTALTKMAAPFLRGEIPATTSIRLSAAWR